MGNDKGYRETERLDDLIDSLNKDELVCMVMFTMGMRLEKILLDNGRGETMGLDTRVRAVRQKQHLSQREFGRRLGMSRSAINHLEHGLCKRPGSILPHVKLISQKFDVSEDWLLHGGDDDDEPLYVPGLSKLLDTLEQGGLEHIAVLCYWTLSQTERRALFDVFKCVLEELNRNFQQGSEEPGQEATDV